MAGKQGARGNSPAGERRLSVHQVLVDPARCRIRPNHNRDYSQLTVENCHDLITSIAHHGQEVAAIVRRVEGESAYDYDLICGARRLFSVSHIRKTNPGFMFRVEVRSLTDKEAFRVSYAENKHRLDISDYERSAEFQYVLKSTYNGSQTEMAKDLDVSESWLSRYLDIVKMPQVIVDAFPSSASIGISHAARLAPSLNRRDRVEAILAEAALLVEEKQALGKKPPSAATVVDRLLKTAGAAQSPPALVDEADSGGHLIARGSQHKGHFTIRVPGAARRSIAEVQAATSIVIAKLFRTVTGSDVSSTHATEPPGGVDADQSVDGKPKGPAKKASPRVRPAKRPPSGKGRPLRPVTSKVATPNRSARTSKEFHEAPAASESHKEPRSIEAEGAADGYGVEP